jgi:cytochrome c biogenesis protein ResB
MDGTLYDLAFTDRQVSLGFHVTLDRFHIGYYPGERRPRSFESTITVVDPGSGRSQRKIVSMNRPAEHGGYTFYQSSYRMGGQRPTSILSVARDPGLPIAFAGYITIMVGMVVVLATRIADRRRMTEGSAMVGIDERRPTAQSGLVGPPESAREREGSEETNATRHDGEPAGAIT